MDHKLQVTLETVTPLFLGGAEGQPELRPPSFRGVLRYWWRVLVGGVSGYSWQDLKEAEDELWGHTGGTGQIIVRLPHQSEPQTKNFPLLPHRKDRRGNSAAIRPQERFTLIFSPRPPHSSLPEGALATLMLFITLGGVGKRSRRGFGTLRLKQVEAGSALKLPARLEPLLRANPKDMAELEEHIRGVLSETCSIAAESLPGPALSPPSSIPEFPILAESQATVLLCRESFTDWEEAMKIFWGKLRSRPYKDNPVFGNGNRQASPLHLRVAKTNEGFHLLMTVLPSKFAKQQPAWKIMDQFLQACADSWQGVFLMGREGQ